MKLQPLYDLQQEINRLFIAGSKFAKGDVRLQKYIPILEKLGEKAPVFKKLAVDIDGLLKADSQQSAEKLMAISILLYSVLYTQGEMTEENAGEKPQEPSIDIQNVNTVYSYLQLKPVIEALTTSSPGRLDILKDAMERDIFKDSRTFKYLDIALADKYSELCYYVENTIIPQIGKPMIPFLLQGFKYEDKTDNVRRLRLLSRLNYESVPAMCDKILSGALPQLQAEVVTILSGNPANEELIIKLADDKNKAVRESAYMALAKLNTRASLEKLKDVYLNNKNKTNLPPIVTALASSKLPFFFQEIFNQVVKSFEDFIALDPTTDDKTLVAKLDGFGTLLQIFKNKDDERIFNFFNTVLQNKVYNELVLSKKNLLSNIAYNIAQHIVNGLGTMEKSRALAFYEKNINNIPDRYWKRPLWSDYLYKAVESGYPKEKVFDTFSELYKKNVIAIRELYNIYINNEVDVDNENEDEIYGRQLKPATGESRIHKMDRRWLPLFYASFPEKIKWNNEKELTLLLIHSLEPGQSKQLDTLLSDLTRKIQPDEQSGIFKLLMERKHPERFELIYTVMARFPKNTYYYAISRLVHLDFWNQFPTEYAPKFRELARQNKQELYNEIAGMIEK